jgi:hypothetical protein
MSTFDVLCSEFKVWRQRYIDDHHASMNFALQFVKKLQNYIGAPDSYKQLSFSETTATNKYVEAKKIIFQDEYTYKTATPDSILDLIQRDEDGYWSFAVCITLEVAPNAFPKQSFAIPVFFIIDDGSAKLRITKMHDGEFAYSLGDDTKNSAAYDFIVELLRENFKRKPADQVSTKTPIGFTYPSST